MMRLFIDTNIVLDYLDDRPGFSASARKLMVLGFLHEFELWMSASQVTDLLYLLTNGGQASEADSAKGSIRKARRFIRICPLTEADVDAALDSAWCDFGDACVYQRALRLRVDAIITRNKRGFEKSSIKVFDCDELFTYLAEEKGLTYDEIPW